jgi:hypothetical protein
MGNGRWLRALGWVLVPAVVAGTAAGCSSSASSGSAAPKETSAAAKALAGAFTSSDLRGALLTKVNGVAAATPASIGQYSSLATSTATKPASTVTVTPKACSGAATTGFNPGPLSGAPAAVVTFKVGTNAVSETLIASAAPAATTALAGKMPAACAKYTEKAAGKTFTYVSKETKVTGIGKQAKALNVKASGKGGANLWSLMYRGSGFVGTVTVIGPNASQKAVTQLGKQAYAYAARSLS